MRNVELKARDPDPARTLELALALGAADEGEIVQRDTYFGGSRARVKLREQTPGDDELIAYRRPTTTRRASASTCASPSPTPRRCARRSTPPTARAWSWRSAAGCCCGRT